MVTTFEIISRSTTVSIFAVIKVRVITTCFSLLLYCYNCGTESFELTRISNSKYNNFNNYYYSNIETLDMLASTLDLESFHNFDIVVITEQGSINKSDFEKLRSEISASLNDLDYKNLLANIQLQFWFQNNLNHENESKLQNVQHLNSRFKSAHWSASRNERVIFYGSFSNLTMAEKFKNEIEAYYRFSHNSRVDCSPYFFIILKLPSILKRRSNIDFKNETMVIKETLKSWSSKFDIASQVYLVVIVKADEPRLYSVINIYEFYQIKNVTIVNSFLPDHIINPDKVPQGNNISLSASFTKLEQRKLDYFKLVKLKTTLRSNFQQVEIVGVDHVKSKLESSPVYAASAKFRYEKINATYSQPFFVNGFDVSQYRYIRDALNFSEAASTYPDFVKPGPNGTLIGMAIPINSGQADLALVVHECVEYRVSGPDGLSYLHPTFKNMLAVYFRQPPANSVRNMFFKAFSLSVWVSLLSVWILIIGSFLFAQYYKNYTLRNSVKIVNEAIDEENSVSWFWVIYASCMKAWNPQPEAISVRMIFVIGFLMSYIVYVAYSAALTSILAVPMVAVKEVQDLLNYGFNFFSDHQVPNAVVGVRILEKENDLPKIENDGPRNIFLGDYIEKLLNTRIAIASKAIGFYPVLMNKGYSSSFICPRVSHIQFSRRPILQGWLMKKASPLRGYFNYKILVMMQTGIVIRFRKYYILETTMQCSRSANTFFQQIGLPDVFSAYLFLSISLIFTVVLLGLEKLWGEFKNR